MCRWPAAAFRMAVHQLFALHRLHQVGHRARLERAVNLLVADIGREHDDPSVRELATGSPGSCPAPFMPGSRRSISVTSGRCVRKRALRLLAGRRLGADRHVRLERDDARQAHADQVVIVDEHDLQLVRHDSSSVVRIARAGRRGAGTGPITAQRVPCAGRAVDLQHAAELVDPLANALQAEMAARARPAAPWPMPQPSSCDDELDCVGRGSAA